MSATASLSLLRRPLVALLVLCLLCLPAGLMASHNLAGQITYRYLGLNRYEITLTTYTTPCDNGVDEPTISFELWARFSGSFIRVPDDQVAGLSNVRRTNGGFVGLCEATSTPGIPVGEYVRIIDNTGALFGTGARRLKKNVYVTTIELRGPGVYEIRYYSPYRTAGILNMTNSGSVTWYVATTLFNVPAQGPNSSPQLLNRPYDDACTNRLWSHNPGAFDPDGDSLVFSRSPSIQYDPSIPAQIFEPIPAPGYLFPDEVSPAADAYNVDPKTGIVTWNTPQIPGIYTVGILVEEYRFGVKIGQVLRDMAIIVRNCNNDPPIIEAPVDTCIAPGQTLSFDVKVRDPNPGDSVLLYLNNDFTSGSFDPSRLNAPWQRGATLTPPNNLSLIPQRIERQPIIPAPPGFFPIVSRFDWLIECDDITAQPYRVDFYATDGRDFNITNRPILADNHVTTIRVSAPPPQNFTATILPNRSVVLNWTAPACPNVERYDIYRATDSLAAAPDACCDGTAGPGYVKIAEVGPTTFTYTDGATTPLPFRGKYCYRVIAVYRPLLGTLVSSCPSNQDCVIQERSFPVIRNVDIETTNPTTGQLLVRWIQPNPTKFSPAPILPFRYKLFQSTGLGTNTFRLVTTFTALNDTTYRISGINTATTGYTYKVGLYDANGDSLSQSDPATSTFLTATAGERAVELSWNWLTPWINQNFDIYRSVNGGPFTLLQTVAAVPGATNQTFRDTGLQPKVPVCYYVDGLGRFSAPDLASLALRNRSEIACATPYDTTPPCGDNDFSIRVDCNTGTVTYFGNLIPFGCNSDLDTVLFVFRRYPNEPFRPIDTLANATAGTLITFTRQDAVNKNIAGCYGLVLIDAAGNRSGVIGEKCVDAECFEFQLPNVITPNGDGINDIFRPLNYAQFSVRQVAAVRCYIYDRWGRQLAFSTDRNNLWNGKINGQPAQAGAYYYTIEIFLEGLTQGEKIVRTGVVNVMY